MTRAETTVILQCFLGAAKLNKKQRKTFNHRLGMEPYVVEGFFNFIIRYIKLSEWLKK